MKWAMLAAGLLLATLSLATVFAASVLLATPALAQEPTDTEKAACRPDALRLCSAGAIAKAMFGDRSGVYECLIAEKRSCFTPGRWRCDLSKPCRDVLTKHGL